MLRFDIAKQESGSNTTQSTQCGHSIMMEKSAQAGEGGRCTPPRIKLWCTLQLRRQIHSPYLYSLPICTGALYNTRGHIILIQTTHSV
jgi:hypothetical protein